MRPLRTLLLTACCLLPATVPALAGNDDESRFGQSTASEAALIGVLYDLKQTQDRRSTSVDPESYSAVLDEFLSHGWDEAVLNRYYRVSKPLYTTQIFIPNMNADMAPRAFGAEGTVRPSRWVIHYKGQVSAPEPGTYRFWGIADDVICAAINGKTVLMGNRRSCKTPIMSSIWKATGTDGIFEGDGNLVPGTWFTVKAGQIVDLDVIIGERPGGVFNAYLMIEKQGTAYPKEGNIIVPAIFQVAPYTTPKSGRDNYAPGYPVWKSYQ